MTTPDARSVRLACGAFQLAVFEDAVRLMSGRTWAQRFQCEPVGLPQYSLERRAGHPENAFSLSPSPAPWGFAWWEDTTLCAHIPDDAWAVEACLRLLWLRATAQQGGLLLHGASVAFGGTAVAAIGESGAGKSTFARHCVGAGATLLSDEMTCWLPDGGGRLLATPFRSDSPLPTAPAAARLGAVFVLEKSLHLAAEPERAAAVMPALWAQVYRHAAVPLPEEEQSARFVSMLAPGIHRFSFPNAPEAGAWVKQWLGR